MSSNYSAALTVPVIVVSSGYPAAIDDVETVQESRTLSWASVWYGLCLRRGMTKIQSFRDLEVWLLAMDLVDEVFKASRKIPRHEFDLRRQMMRAAVSIPSNVAEGWKRKRKRGAYQNHVSIAMGSQAELDTQVEVCFRNAFLAREQWTVLTQLLMCGGLMLERLHDALD